MVAGAIQAMKLNIDAEASVFRAAHPSTPAWKAVAICWFKARCRSSGKAQADRIGAGGPLKTRAGKILEDIHLKPQGRTNTAIARTQPAPITTHEDRHKPASERRKRRKAAKRRAYRARRREREKTKE